MRINITAWCRYVENYSLEITEEYLKQMNEWVRGRYPDVEFEDITAEDIYAVFGMYEVGDSAKLKTELTDWYTLGNFIEEYVREDVWESYEDNEYIDVDDYETRVEFDTAAEREHFEGKDDIK